ncbi:YHYH protein [Shewanella salipaludis]|uniref:YHYH protein n=1 Tax=Shewanella salipaludis TaxID=2723052 RepID=A0A972FVG1_9GAMM|nr:YHYH protein [Shewanella salipaludis]NMH66342.1 YHYH protein [Shewanella salipaludis]
MQLSSQFPAYFLRLRGLALLLSVGLALTACGGGGSADDGGTVADSSGGAPAGGSQGSQNAAPIASAGEDQYSFVGATVTLDGRGSSDADGDSLSYSWTLAEQPAGSHSSLGNATSASPTLVPDQSGNYLLRLEVSDGTEISNLDEVSVTAAEWLLNTNVRSSYIKSNGNGVLVNVQGLQTSASAGTHYLTVATTGIPDYKVTLSQSDVDWLNNRPKAASDFYGGVTSAKAGEAIAFGQNIGYKPVGSSCSLGYWPPGPACPSNQSAQLKLPTEPAPAGGTACATSLNTIGLMLNGAAVFNWQDGSSYNNQQVWLNLAPVFEQYDVDICQGHAQQQGNYHHHMYSACLQTLLEDNGSGHSPIYGFAADGYPIYGPYTMQGVLAKSAWIKRDYSAASVSGCGADGVRSCQLVDQYDLSKGTQSVSAGPDTDTNVTTMSGNSIAAVSGIYFEDYYYDAALTAMGGEYLDQHNGHDHDGLGYHYHVTAQSVAGQLQPVFPYQVGPTFYGELPADTFASCGN